MGYNLLINGIYWVITHLQTVYKIPGTSKYAIISACINMRRVHRCSDRYSGQSLVDELNSDQVHISDALQVTNHCWVLLWFPGHLGMKQTKKGITRDQSVVMCQESFLSHPCFQIWFAMSSWDLGSLKIPNFLILLALFYKCSTTSFNYCNEIWQVLPSLLVKFFWGSCQLLWEKTPIVTEHWRNSIEMTRWWHVWALQDLFLPTQKQETLLFFFSHMNPLDVFLILTSLT